MSGEGWRQTYRVETKPYAVVVLTEEHLPEKWRREVHQTVPLSYVEIARHPADVTAFVKQALHLDRRTLCVLILPKSMAKLGSGWTGAWTWRLSRRPQAVRLPALWRVLQRGGRGRTAHLPGERLGLVPRAQATLLRLPRTTVASRAPKDNQPYFPAAEQSPMGDVRNPPPVRYPLAEFICRQYRGFFDLAIIDEAHRYNARGDRSGLRLSGAGPGRAARSGRSDGLHVQRTGLVALYPAAHAEPHAAPAVCLD